MKKYLWPYICLAFFFVFATSAIAAEKEFSGGDGTPESPYLVATAEDLNNVRHYLDAHFLQTADIDLGVAPWNQGEGWEPIGNKDLYFIGTFDGKDYKINGLFIDRPEDEYVGLFGFFGEGASISNMVLENIDVAGNIRVGGLVGKMKPGTIANCFVSGRVSGGNVVGGLVGYSTVGPLGSDDWKEGSILNSCFTGDVVSGAGYAGGLIGMNSGGSIVKSYFLGNVSGEGTTGGLAGQNYTHIVIGYGQFDGFIKDCYAAGDVSSGGNRVGGLIGNNGGQPTVVTSYAAMNVWATGTSIGGLIGHNNNSSFDNIIDSYWDADVGPDTSQGGTGKTTSEMMQQNTFLNWDFDNVWRISDGTTYPYLIYQPKDTYTVTYNANEATSGTAPDSQVKTHDIDLMLATNSGGLALIGYNFTGWNTSADGKGVDYVEGGTYSDNAALTLYAKWIIKQYTVTFVDHDGSELDSQTVNHGSAATAPADPILEGYTFTIWDASFDNVTADITVTAQYDINQYTIIFEDHDGTELETQTVNHGDNANAPPDPSREGYTFIGWDNTFDNVTDNFSVTAQYTRADTDEMPRRVLSGEDQEIDITSDSKIIGTGASETLNIYPNINVDFTAGDGDRVNLPYNLEYYDITSMGNHIFFSDTAANKVVKIIVTGTSTVGFVDGSTATLEMVFTPGAPPQVELGGEEVGSEPLDHSLVSLEGVTYTVTFKDYDGTVLDSQAVNHGSGATTPADPSREGYTFTGWDMAFDNVVESLTVTAQYSINQYTITFDSAGGSAVDPIAQDFGNAITPPTDPIRQGYAFVGWNPEVPAAMPAQNQTLTAQWAINQHIVSFHDHDGTELDTQTVNHGGSAIAPADPASEGFTFIGWDVSFDNVTADMTVTAQYAINTPENLQAEAGDQQVTLTWDATEGAKGYYLYYGIHDDIHPSHGDSYDERIELGVISQYTVEDLVNDTTYFFVLTADVSGSESVPSNVVSAMPAEFAADFTNSIGMTFNYIEPGTFMMGSPEDEPGRSDDETQHQVTLTQGYHMQTTPVTQGQWEAVMGDNPSWFSNCGADCPVERRSWHDAQNFIAALNDLEDTDRYALPTEAQWEYAARAGSTTAFANGQITETGGGYDPVLDSMGWYWYNSQVDYSPNFLGQGTHPVAQKDPNAWGLYDMHGNVYDWVADWYGDYPTSAVTDPTGPEEGTGRVMRGGTWGSFARSHRSANRHTESPDAGNFNVGFRLVLLPGH